MGVRGRQIFRVAIGEVLWMTQIFGTSVFLAGCLDA